MVSEEDMLCMWNFGIHADNFIPSRDPRTHRCLVEPSMGKIATLFSVEPQSELGNKLEFMVLWTFGPFRHKPPSLLFPTTDHTK